MTYSTYALYHNSYQFYSSNDLKEVCNEGEAVGIVEKKIRKQYSKDKSNYWAAIKTGSIEKRYKIIDGVFTNYNTFDWSKLK